MLGGARPDRQTGARHRFHRQRAGADLAGAWRNLNVEAIADFRGDDRQQPPRRGLDVHFGPRQQTQRRQAFGDAIRIAIEPQRRFERGEADLVDAQRPLHRIALDARDQILAADDEAGLRAAQKLIAREGDEIGAGGDGFLDRRLVRQPVAGEIDQRAGAQIVDQRHFAFARERREIARGNLLGKALDAIIRGVHLEMSPVFGPSAAT